MFAVSVEKFGIAEAEKKFEKILTACSAVDFGDAAYQASGKGRVRVKNTVLLYASMLTPDQLPEPDRDLYLELLKKYPRK
ncbi:MAG: hypothetical protein L0387_14190 [Acidobacteria bacterium]|nr:hypothetical protein [Acidobacteriota bacterium]